MTNFIKLTNANGDYFWINPAMIVSMRRTTLSTAILSVATDFSKVAGADPEYGCLETPEEILALIKGDDNAG